MKKIRIGNDLEVVWSIYAEGDTGKEAYNLDGRNLTLYVIGAFGRKKIDNYTINGNTIRWVFLGKDQYYLGVYSFELQENEGLEGMHTVDKCNAFALLKRMCEDEYDEDEDNVETVTLNLSSTFFVKPTDGTPGGNIDIELLEGFIPLSRDFSDDFSNDFAR